MASPLVSVHPAGVMETLPWSIKAATDEMSASTGANSAAVVALPADGGDQTEGVHGHNVGKVWWSYIGSTTPAGRLTIADSEGVKIDFDITAPGLGQMDFAPARLFKAGDAVTATLFPGGAAVTGKIGLVCWRQK